MKPGTRIRFDYCGDGQERDALVIEELSDDRLLVAFISGDNLLKAEITRSEVISTDVPEPKT